LQLDGDTQTTNASESTTFYITYKINDDRQNSAKIDKFKKIDQYASHSHTSIERITLPLYTRANRDKLLCHLEVQSFGATSEQVLLAGTALIVSDF